MALEQERGISITSAALEFELQGRRLSLLDTPGHCVAAGRREPVVGVVGALQYDVIVSRLRTEYGVAVDIEPAGYSAARWLADRTGPPSLPGGQIAVAVDRQERRVLLFTSEWELQYFQRHHPDVVLLDESPTSG